MAGMLFVDGHIERGAVYFACACHHQAFHSQVATCLTDIECALDVGVDITVGGNITIRDGYQGRQVQHGVAPAHYLATIIGVANVAAHHLKVVVMHIIEPTPIVE